MKIFKKRKERGVFGFKDALNITISEKPQKPHKYYDKKFISCINNPSKRSPKITLSPGYEFNHKADFRINQNIFHIIENLDYIYEWHLRLDKAFDISFFPLNKKLRVTNLWIYVNDL